MKGLLFTYLSTYGGAVVALFNPFVGFLIYVSFAIISPPHMWFWSVPEGNYSRIIGVALLLGWVFKGFGNWRLGKAWSILLALLAFWGWCGLWVVLAPMSDVAEKYFVHLTKIVLPCVVGVTLIDSVAKLKQLAWTILLSQGYAALEFNLTYYSGYNRLWNEGFAGMDNNSVAISLVTCVGLAFFLGLNARSWWAKAVAVGVTLCLVNAIFFSFSRGGMLALGITGLTCFILLPKRPGHYLIFAMVVFIALRLAGPEVVNRFSTVFVEEGSRDASAQSRIELWKACIQSMMSHPFGVGPDHWGFVVTQYGFKEGKEAHTMWLTIGAEVGVVGLLSLGLFYGLCVLRLWPLSREKHPVSDPWLRHLARMVIASLVGFGVAAQFVSLDMLEIPYYVCVLGAGCLKVASTQTPDSQMLSGPSEGFYA